jgi:hypothetical protein
MDFKDIFNNQDTENSLIQNRLTVTGFSLTILIFSGSFTLSLFNSFPQDLRGGYQSTFLHIEVSLATGIIVSVLTLASFLMAQQSKPIPQSASSESVLWFQTKRWWFSAGQVLLYLTLTQALSCSLTEVVYGAGLSNRILGILLGLVALPVWWFLLFLGPITFIWRYRRILNRSGLFALVIIYVVFLVAILGFNAEAYRLIQRTPFTVTAFLIEFLNQLIQPIFWCVGACLGN